MKEEKEKKSEDIRKKENGNKIADGIKKEEKEVGKEVVVGDGMEVLEDGTEEVVGVAGIMLERKKVDEDGRGTKLKNVI